VALQCPRRTLPPPRIWQTPCSNPDPTPTPPHAVHPPTRPGPPLSDRVDQRYKWSIPYSGPAAPPFPVPTRRPSASLAAARPGHVAFTTINTSLRGRRLRPAVYTNGRPGRRSPRPSPACGVTTPGDAVRVPCVRPGPGGRGYRDHLTPPPRPLLARTLSGVTTAGHRPEKNGGRGPVLFTRRTRQTARRAAAGGPLPSRDDGRAHEGAAPPLVLGHDLGEAQAMARPPSSRRTNSNRVLPTGRDPPPPPPPPHPPTKKSHPVPQNERRVPYYPARG